MVTKTVELIGNTGSSNPYALGELIDWYESGYNRACGSPYPDYVFASLYSPSSERDLDVYYRVPVSSIISAAGLYQEDVNTITVYAEANTGYSWGTSCSSGIVNGGISKASSIQLMLACGEDSNTVVISNDGDTCYNSMRIYDFSSNVDAEALLERSGSGSNTTYDGVKITRFYAVIDYNPCVPVVSAAQFQKNSGGQYISIPSDGTTTQSGNNGDVRIYGLYDHTGPCSSVFGYWSFSVDGGSTYYTLPVSSSSNYFNDKWFALDAAVVKFRYAAASSGVPAVYSGVLTVNRNFPTPTLTVTKTCNSATLSITYASGADPVNYDKTYAIKKTSDSSYGSEQSSPTFNNLSPGTSYTVKVIYRGTGHKYVPDRVTNVLEYTSTFSTEQARITDYGINDDDVTCNSIKIHYSSTDTCGSTVYAQYSSDNSNWYNISSSTKTVTGLTPNTLYYFRFYSTNVSYLTASKRTKIAVISINTIQDDDRKCTSFKFTANHSCNFSMNWYVIKDDSTIASGTTTTGTEKTVSSLIPNSRYLLRITASNTTNFETNIDTKPVNLSVLVSDTVEGTTTEGDGKTVTVEYPRRLSVTSTSNCTQEATLQWSDDGAQWHNFTSTVDIYKPYNPTSQTYQYLIRATLTISGTTYTSTQTWLVSEPVMNITARGTFSGAPAAITVNDSDTISVFDTGSSPLLIVFSSSWANSSIISKSLTATKTNPDGTTNSISSTIGSYSWSFGISYNQQYAGVYYAMNPITYAFTYGGTQIKSITSSFNILPIVFTTANGYITATASSFGDKRVYGFGAVTGEITGVSGERMSFDAGGFGTANFEYTWIPQVAELLTSNWTNLVDRSDGIDSTVPGDSSRRTLIAINTGKKFRYLFTVTATDDIGKQYTSGQQTITAYFTVDVGIVAEVTLLPDPAVGAKEDTEFIADASKSFVQGYQYRLTHEWDIKKNNVSAKDKAIVVSGYWDENNITIQLKDIGTYTLTDTISGEYYEGGEWVTIETTTTWGLYNNEGRIVIKEIIDTEIPDFSRFALVISNKDKCFVASRTKVPYFTELKFGKYLSNIGILTCKIIGIDKVLNDEGIGLEDVISEPGATVCLLDRMNPVWIGVISETSETETNYYDRAPEIKIYNITAYESTKQLSIDFLPNTDKGLVSGTITDIAKKIIPQDNQGLIGTSKVNYGISLSNTSRLVALDQLYSQAGWRYRCRPNTKVYWKTITSGDYTISSADLIEGTSVKQNDIFVYYNDNQYGCGIVESYETLPQGSYPSFKTTYSLGNTLPSSGYVSVYNSFLIDFRPSYYQTYNTRIWTTNYDAVGVNANQNIRDKFGTAIVYGVGYSGESIASKMEAWMKINKDYTIDNSMRITRSYDSEVDTVVKIDEVVYNNQTFCRYAITFNGWSFPDIVSLTRLSQDTSQGGMNVKPRVYYVNINREMHFMELWYNLPNEGQYELAENPRRYYDQANNKKCTYTVAIPKGIGVSGDPATLQTSVIDSLVQLSNVIFPVFAVDNIVGLPEINKDIYVGDMTCKLTHVDSNYSEVKVDYNVSSTDWENSGIPHGHLTDVLVMPPIENDTDTPYSPSNVHPESPRAMYPDTSFTSQGPEGYSIMEMERLACRYMQYGSNFNAQGKCNIGAIFFYRNDYEIGAVRLPMVGDRIAIKKMLADGSDYDEPIPYELQQYEFDMDNYTVTIVFGMPIINVGDFIYNLQANSGLSIIPADS